jgi:glycosyltransferase involved in cell wall biosynthesis
MLKLIVNCGPAEQYIGKCIESLRSQSLTDWEAYLAIDPFGDRTAEQAILVRDGDRRIHIRQNEQRKYSLVNLVESIRLSAAEPEDVIVVLDGDDWFATWDALRIIYETYQRSDCWMTYGSWISDVSPEQGRWPAYPEDISDFRSHPWLGTAVRTWKRWLWDLIEERDLRDASGEYFCVTEDQAVMLPMLEMSGAARAKHISDILMIYNRSSPHACCYVRREEMLRNEAYIRSRPAYRRLVRNCGGVRDHSSV